MECSLATIVGAALLPITPKSAAMEKNFLVTFVFYQALMRRNTHILQCILSHEEFRMDELPAVVRQEGAEIVLFALRDVGVEA